MPGICSGTRVVGQCMRPGGARSAAAAPVRVLGPDIESWRRCTERRTTGGTPQCAHPRQGCSVLSPPSTALCNQVGGYTVLIASPSQTYTGHTPFHSWMCSLFAYNKNPNNSNQLGMRLSSLRVTTAGGVGAGGVSKGGIIPLSMTAPHSPLGSGAVGCTGECENKGASIAGEPSDDCAELSSATRWTAARTGTRVLAASTARWVRLPRNQDCRVMAAPRTIRNPCRNRRPRQAA